MLRKSLLCFLLLLILAVSPGGMAFGEDAFTDFTDTTDHWAAESIMVCRAHNLMGGYPGNKFMPKQEMSRVEALVVINRSMGWEEAASNISTSGINFPSDLSSGFRGHVALAAEKNLIYKESIASTKFNVPATRLEIALWLSSALNVTGNGDNLNFSDLNTIPSVYRSDTYLNMLAGVVEKGIIKGMPGNLFEPNKSLTRAEMAAMVVRMLDNGQINAPSGQQVIGKLTQVDWSGRKITVETTTGAKSYDLAGSYVAFRSGKKTGTEAVKVGENVKLSLNSAGKGIFIAYYGGSASSSPAQTPVGGNTYTGSVKSVIANFLVFQPDSGATLALTISPSVEVTLSGNQSSLAAVTAGASGTITVSDDKVVKIALTGSGSSVGSGDKGYVVNKYWDYFSVRLEDGTVEEINITGLSFSKGGAGSTYGAMQKGTYVELVRSGSSVSVVRILDGDRRVFGEITSRGSNSITIDDDDDRSYSYTVVSNARIRDKDNKSVDLRNIERYINVELILNDNGDVKEIRMGYVSGAQEGIVEDIRTSGSKRIIIENDGGDEFTYYLADDVTVKEGSTTRNLSYVDEGMHVKLTLNSNDEVSRIDILNYTVVEGEVLDIKTSGSKWIEIETSNGREKRYDVADSVTVKEGSATRNLSYIDDGMDVELSLNDDDEVVHIYITGGSKKEGEVTYINPSGSNKRIEIEISRNKHEVYDISDDVTVKEGSATRNLRYVEEGMEVKLTLNSRDEVTRIDITGSKTVEGEVTYIRSTGTKKWMEIKIGSKHEPYNISNSVVVRDGSRTRDLGYVEKGMDVEITLDDDDEVIRIDIL